MKKSLLFIPMSMMAMVLASCSFAISIRVSSSESEYSSAQQSSQKTSEGTSQASSQGTSTDTSQQSSASVDPEGRTKLSATYKDYAASNLYPIDATPCAGSAKLLVIPVWFTDSTTFIASSKRDQVRSDISKAYFGSKEDTGWNSVKTFYETESQGKLSLSGTVTDWYETGTRYSSYAPSESGGNATMDLVKTASDAYFSAHPEDPRTNYDCDGNGYLDGVMLIYAAPDYVSLGRDSYSNLWAYCYWLQDEGENDKKNPGANTFFWASYDFMYDATTALERTGKSNYAYGDNSNTTVDGHTFIHEMGHAFGLDDYYDYGENRYCPAGGFSMQEENVGGHDPYSVMALGWADPYIPTKSCEITISAFQKNHDVILLTPSFNSYGTPYDEYLLLELYTPTGLNELDATHQYAGTCDPLNATGIRLWHVDARLTYCDEVDREGYPIFSTTLTSDLDKGRYGVTTAMTNTYDDEDYGSPLGPSYYKYNLLQLVRNNTSTSTPTKNTVRASDLFRDGSSFSMGSFGRQFARTGLLNSGAQLGWEFSVRISGSGNDATAKVTLTKK